MGNHITVTHQANPIIIYSITITLVLYVYSRYSSTQQTVKKDLENKWRQQLQEQQQQQKKRGHRGHATYAEDILPPFDGSIRPDHLLKYIEYCCQFSWRMVTQVPPLKIEFKSEMYDPKIHNESSSFAKEKKTCPSQVKCYLWPTLLDCDNRVIEKGEVVLNM